MSLISQQFNYFQPLILVLMVTLVGCKPQFEQLPREQIVDTDNQQAETSSQPTRNDVEPAVSFSAPPSLPNQKAIGNIQFQNVAKETGLDFTYQNGADGRLLMVESLGGGVAWLDYDIDGRLDTYFTQGGKPDVDVSEKTWRSTVEKRSAGLKKEPGQVDVSDSTG